MPLPEKDEMFNTKGKMMQDILVSLGGRIAEEIIFDDVTTGASQDIKVATKTARAMITRFGFSEKLGLVNYENDDEVFIGRDFGHTQAYSEEIAAAIDEEVKDIIDDCYKKASKIIKEHEDVLHKCANLLLEKERITKEEFEGLFVDENTSVDLEKKEENKEEKLEESIGEKSVSVDLTKKETETEKED